MEFQQWFNQIPKFTRYYMLGVFVTTFAMTYIKFFPLVYYIYLNYDLIFSSLQIWRLFTNFLVVGKFSFNFLFFMMMTYNTVSRLEKAAVEARRYAEFVMLLVYTTLFIHLLSIIMHYIFGMDTGMSLCFELLFALIYIECKRDPEKLNAYLPFALMFFTLITGGNIVSDIIGIAAGHLYFYLKDLAPLHQRFDLLKTPQILTNYFNGPQRRTVEQGNSAVRTVNNQNTSGSFGNSSGQPQQNSGTSFRENDQGTGNRYQPFTGRGYSWGS